MNKTLLKLFEQNEPDFRKELSAIQLPRDEKRLRGFLSDFFVNQVSVEEYKKELSLGEISVLNSLLKVINIPAPFEHEIQPLPLNAQQIREFNNVDKHVSQDDSFSSILDITTIGTTTVGGIIGGLLFKTWGGVLLSIAGCALGMYLSSSNPKTKKNAGSPTNRKIDVDKYIQTLKSICKGIDDVILNYHTSIDNIIKEYESAPKPTLATAYKPLLDRLASLYVALETVSLPTEVKSEFDKLFRTLKNHHYEVLCYNDETKDFFIITESAHVSKPTVVKAAVLENGKLIESGECLIPEK